MRVNFNLVPDMLADINQSQSALNTVLEEVATGKSVNQPSDNPLASAQMVDNYIESADVDQYSQNVNSVLSTVQTAGSALSSVATALTQAISLGTEGANGTSSSSDRQDLATQIQSILSNVVALANTSVEGNYIFGGTITDQPPYTADSSSPTGYTYNGNNNSNSVAVGNNLNIQVGLPGNQIFTGSSNSILGALSTLVTALQSGTGSSIATATAGVTTALNSLGQAQGFYSNAEASLNDQQTALQQDTVTLSTQASNLVDVNEATAATELSQAEIDNSAALAAAAKVLPNTLLNYLTPPA